MDQFNSLAESVSGGQLTPSAEQEVNKVFGALQLDQNPHVRKTSDALSQLYSNMRHGGYVKDWNYCFINETLFFQCTPQERIFAYGWAFYGTEAMQKETQKVTYARYGLTAVQIGLPCLLYLSLVNYSINFGIVFPSVIILSSLFSMLNAYVIGKLQAKIVLNVDQFISHKFDCAQGGIDYLNRVKEFDPEYVQVYLPNIDDRLANLKKLV